MDRATLVSLQPSLGILWYELILMFPDERIALTSYLVATSLGLALAVSLVRAWAFGGPASGPTSAVRNDPDKPDGAMVCGDVDQTAWTQRGGGLVCGLVGILTTLLVRPVVTVGVAARALALLALGWAVVETMYHASLPWYRARVSRMKQNAIPGTAAYEAMVHHATQHGRPWVTPQPLALVLLVLPAVAITFWSIHWSMWLVRWSGNVNFYFSGSLMAAFALVMLCADMLGSVTRLGCTAAALARAHVHVMHDVVGSDGPATVSGT